MAQATLEQSIVVTQADAKASKELSDAQAVTADLLASNKRLSIRASCVPASGGPGVVNAGSAILDQDARRAYFAHRELIVKKDAQIKGLQEIVRGLSSAHQD
jgi:Bacteriophage lysis protein.